jgi:SNF2 family DNA or RNA helicase
VLIAPYSKVRGWADHLAGEIRTVIFDEAQELRRSESQKWTACAQIADQAAYRIGLTATPVYNYGGEIHTVLQVIAPDVLGSRDEFLREWCGRQDIRGHAVVRDPGGLGIYLREQGVMLRRTRKDVGRELPEVVRVPHAIDTDEDLLEELVADAVDLAEVIVSRAASRQELWRASGDFDWRMRRATGLAKAPYVAEFVKLLLETEERVVLFGWHRDVYKVWEEKLARYGLAFYTGTESPTQKQAARDRFLSGDARVLVMSLRSGAGLDGLQEAAHVAVFGELDWSPGMHDQCIGRLHRDGQDEGVVAYFLVSDHGADPVMAEVLNLKRQQAEPLRDPDAPLFTPAVDPGDRLRILAEDVLAARSRRRAA